MPSLLIFHLRKKQIFLSCWFIFHLIGWGFWEETDLKLFFFSHLRKHSSNDQWCISMSWGCLLTFLSCLPSGNHKQASIRCHLQLFPGFLKRTHSISKRYLQLKEMNAISIFWAESVWDVDDKYMQAGLNTSMLEKSVFKLIFWTHYVRFEINKIHAFLPWDYNIWNFISERKWWKYLIIYLTNVQIS